MTETHGLEETGRGRLWAWRAALWLGSLGFWGAIFNRSILAMDDMYFILRGGQPGFGVLTVMEMASTDLMERNGRIADVVLSVVSVGGEAAARAYFALALSTMFVTAHVWLSNMAPIPVGIRDKTTAWLHMVALPVVAATTPFLLFALDRRLISQLALFGAASSGYLTGLFLVTLGLIPVFRAVNGYAVRRRAMVLGWVSLVPGVLFHESLGAIVLGASVVVGSLALVERRPLLWVMSTTLMAVGLMKFATPGLWLRVGDTEQRQVGAEPLLVRADTALSYAAVAFLPLVAFFLVAVLLSMQSRGVSLTRTQLILIGGIALGLIALAFAARVLGGLPIPGGLLAVAVMVAVATGWLGLRGGLTMNPVELIAAAAAASCAAVPVVGGILPGRAWFFAEFLVLLLALSSLIRLSLAAAVSRKDLMTTNWLKPLVGFLVPALLGSGLVLAPILGYEMIDKVNDNYAWRAFVAEEVKHQEDGRVEIPWNYPWDDMRPSYALDEDYQKYEGFIKEYFGIDEKVQVIWTSSVPWGALE